MIAFTHKLLARLVRDEQGLTAVEYAVLGALVVGAIAAGGVTFTGELSTALAGLIP